jgi:hypothetical protein
VDVLSDVRLWGAALADPWGDDGERGATGGTHSGHTRSLTSAFLVSFASLYAKFSCARRPNRAVTIRASTALPQNRRGICSPLRTSSRHLCITRASSSCP